MHHLHDLIQQFGAWYQHTLATGGYPLIVFMMALESSVVPIPSEMVIPFAAQLAYANGGITLSGVILAGTFGSWLGATAMYVVSRLAGRPLVARYGRYVWIPESKVVAAEQWSARFGSVGIFVSRMVPVVRHLIGIPAGIVRMNYLKYSIYTAFGSAIWCSILAWVGVVAGKDEALMHGDITRLTIWVAGAGIVLCTIYYFAVHRMIARKAA